MKRHPTCSTGQRNVTGAATIEPHILLRRDGPFFRVRPVPADALPPSIRQPETYAGYLAATMAAKLLSSASGWPVRDLTIKATAPEPSD